MSEGGRWGAQRLSFGAVAAAYESSRPSWPTTTAAWLAGAEPGGPRADVSTAGTLRVLDLGAGTGLLTRTLVELGYQVIAVDPSEGMLRELARAVPQVAVRTGVGEELPLPDADVDAVTVAQAWHWMDEAAAGAECARVLRAGGVLGVGWHVRDESVAWVRELAELVRRPADSSVPPTEQSDGAPALTLPGDFDVVQSAVFGHEQRLDVDGLVRLASSWSYVAVAADRDDLLAGVRALGERVAGPDATVLVPYRTRCYRAVRR